MPSAAYPNDVSSCNTDQTYKCFISSSLKHIFWLSSYYVTSRKIVIRVTVVFRIHRSTDRVVCIREIHRVFSSLPYWHRAKFLDRGWVFIIPVCSMIYLRIIILLANAMERTNSHCLPHTRLDSCIRYLRNEPCNNDCLISFDVADW